MLRRGNQHRGTATKQKVVRIFGIERNRFFGYRWRCEEGLKLYCSRHHAEQCSEDQKRPDPSRWVSGRLRSCPHGFHISVRPANKDALSEKPTSGPQIFEAADRLFDDPPNQPAMRDVRILLQSSRRVYPWATSPQALCSAVNRFFAIPSISSGIVIAHVS